MDLQNKSTHAGRMTFILLEKCLHPELRLSERPLSYSQHLHISMGPLFPLSSWLSLQQNESFYFRTCAAENRTAEMGLLHLKTLVFHLAQT